MLQKADIPQTGCKTILLFGAPGVGKGTQGRILGQIPGFFHLSCGEVFRSIDVDSPEGREIYQYTSRGDLVPDELTIKIWKKALDGHFGLSRYKPQDDLLILDGIPRNVEQARILEQYIEVLQVIYLVSSDENAMIDRIKRRAIQENRPDDANEEVIRQRFEVYHRESQPVLSYYPEEFITQVDAIGSPAEVLRSILDIVIPLQNEHFCRNAG